MSRSTALYTGNWGQMCLNVLQRYEVVHDDKGFSLLETVITLFIISVVLSVTLPISGRFVNFARLIETRETLVMHLRLAQAMSEANGQFAMVALAPYSARYTNYTGLRPISTISFQWPVHYRDNYLQMNSGRISYDTAGNAPMSGVVRLQVDSEESDIELFMGAGLAVQTGVTVK